MHLDWFKFAQLIYSMIDPFSLLNTNMNLIIQTRVILELLELFEFSRGLA